MKISNTLNTLYANKHNLAFAICLSVVVMILFRSLTFSVVAVAFITSPHLILILKNDNQECLFSRTNIMSMSVLYYSLGSLVPLVIAMIPSYIVSLFLKDGTTLKIAMIIFLFRLYSLSAPYLYKIATGNLGKKYTIYQWTLTAVTLGGTESVIYVLHQLVKAQPMASFVAAPLVCFSYVIALYLITIINLQNNHKQKNQ